MAMNGNEYRQWFAASRPTSYHSRTKTTLERLPKFCIRHLYREHIAPPRNEDKVDMVNALWAHFWESCGDKPRVQAFWAAVDREYDYAARVKAAKASGQPRPLS
jgi:hypothetical protein